MKIMLPVLALLAMLAPQTFAAAAGPIINGQGTATLTWQAPTQAVGNLPLATPITGFVLYWGEQSRFGRCANAPATDPGPTMISNPADKPVSKVDTACYPNHMDIVPGSARTQALTLSLNKSTTVFFTLVAYQNTGAASTDISAFSNQVSKVFTLTVNAQPLPPVLQSVDVTVSCTTDDADVTCSFTVQ